MTDTTEEACLAAAKARASELRERKTAVRDVISSAAIDDLDEALAALPPEVLYDPEIAPHVGAIRAGLNGLRLPALPVEEAEG